MSEVQQLPITAVQMAVLEVIREDPHATLEQIRQRLSISQVLLMGALRALQRKGALHPSLHDPKVIEFSVEGRPRPQGSKTVISRPQAEQAFEVARQQVVLIESGGRNLDAWRSIVRDIAALHRPPAPWDGPVRGEFVFYLGEPRGDSDWPIGPPDADKLLRAVFDALQQAGVITNDSRIVDPHAPKKFSKDGRYGVDVRLELLPRRGGGSVA